ncbi:MAG: tetratricopeptide repeat protein [Deltaproteobacteria bacterium]|nr:tetratricopeptide repeat protein [Deltaproteobacteria bacterium]
MKYLKPVFTIIFSCGLFVCAGEALGQDETGEDVSQGDDSPDEAPEDSPVYDVNDKAMAEFQKGIDLFEAGKYIDAADSFRAAMAEKSSWKMYYNIGQSEAAAQRYGLALEAFEAYLVAGGDDVPFAKKDEVLAEIERLRLLVGVVELKAPEWSELVIDGYVRGIVPIEGVIRVAAGPHHIQVRCKGEILFDADVKIAGGVTTPIDAGNSADEVQNEVNLKQHSTSDNSQSDRAIPKKLLAGIVTGGAGVLVTGLGVAFLIKGTKDADEAEEWNNMTPRPDAKIDKYNDKTLPLNTAMTVAGLALGGAAMAAGTVLIIFGLKEKKKRDVSVVPTLGGLSVKF